MNETTRGNFSSLEVPSQTKNIPFNEKLKKKINWAYSLTCKTSGYSFLLVSVLNVRTSKMMLYVQWSKHRTAKKVTIVILYQVCSLDFPVVNDRSIYLKFLFTLKEHDFFEVLMNKSETWANCGGKKMNMFIFAPQFSLQSKNWNGFSIKTPAIRCSRKLGLLNWTSTIYQMAKNKHNNVILRCNMT